MKKLYTKITVENFLIIEYYLWHQHENTLSSSFCESVSRTVEGDVKLLPNFNIQIKMEALPLNTNLYINMHCMQSLIPSSLNIKSL